MRLVQSAISRRAVIALSLAVVLLTLTCDTEKTYSVVLENMGYWPAHLTVAGETDSAEYGSSVIVTSLPEGEYPWELTMRFFGKDQVLEHWEGTIAVTEQKACFVWDTAIGGHYYCCHEWRSDTGTGEVRRKYGVALESHYPAHLTVNGKTDSTADGSTITVTSLPVGDYPWELTVRPFSTDKVLARWQGTVAVTRQKTCSVHSGRHSYDVYYFLEWR